MIHTQLTVFCDKCEKWVYLDSTTKKDALAEIKKLHFRFIKGRHICPKCQGLCNGWDEEWCNGWDKTCPQKDCYKPNREEASKGE